MTRASQATKRTRPKRVTVWALYRDIWHYECIGVFTSRAKADSRVAELQAIDPYTRTYVILPQTLNAAKDWEQP